MFSHSAVGVERKCYEDTVCPGASILENDQSLDMHMADPLIVIGYEFMVHEFASCPSTHHVLNDFRTVPGVLPAGT